MFIELPPCCPDEYDMEHSSVPLVGGPKIMQGKVPALTNTYCRGACYACYSFVNVTVNLEIKFQLP